MVADRLPPVSPNGDDVAVADDDADLLERHAEFRRRGDLGSVVWCSGRAASGR